MGIFGHSHAWRAIALAWGMAWFGPTADLAAGTMDRAGSSALIGGSIQPFELIASTLSEGALREKWPGVGRKLHNRTVQLVLFHADPVPFLSPAALQVLSILD